MTRQELEQLCQPLTPEETLEELESLRDEYDFPESASRFTALNAGYQILEKVIEEITTGQLPPSVQVRKMIY